MVTHNLKPIYDQNSKIIILGTMPSPKSREIGFYYSHPQNRFWKIMGQVLMQTIPESNEEKRELLLRNGIALWDVLKVCEIQGADDSSISNPVANDLSCIFREADIKAVFTTGKKATEYYNKLCKSEAYPISPIYLSSTSPANCRIKFEDMVEEYRILRQYILLSGPK